MSAVQPRRDDKVTLTPSPSNSTPVSFWDRELGKVGGVSITPTRLAIGTVAVLGTFAVVGGGVWWWKKPSAEQKELTALRKTAEEKAVEVVRDIGNDVINGMMNEGGMSNKVAVDAAIRDAEKRAKNGVATTLKVLTERMVYLAPKVVEKLKATRSLDMSSLDGLVGEAAVRSATSLMTKVNDAGSAVLDGLAPLTVEWANVELAENTMNAVVAKMGALKEAAVRSAMMKLKATVKSDGEREILRGMAWKVAVADSNDRIKLEKVRAKNTINELEAARMGTGPAMRALVEAMCDKTVATVREAKRLKSLDGMAPKKLKVLSWLQAEWDEKLTVNNELEAVKWVDKTTAVAREHVLKILETMKVLTEAEAKGAREALKEKAERAAKEKVPAGSLPEDYTQPEATDYWTNAPQSIKAVGQNYVRTEAGTLKAKLKNMLEVEKWENKNDAPTEGERKAAIEAWILRRRNTEVVKRMIVVDAMKRVEDIANAMETDLAKMTS
jgi:hypothetical protein